MTKLMMNLKINRNLCRYGWTDKEIAIGAINYWGMKTEIAASMWIVFYNGKSERGFSTAQARLASPQSLLQARLALALHSASENPAPTPALPWLCPSLQSVSWMSYRHSDLSLHFIPSFVGLFWREGLTPTSSGITPYPPFSLVSHSPHSLPDSTLPCQHFGCPTT